MVVLASGASGEWVGMRRWGAASVVAHRSEHATALCRCPLRTAAGGSGGPVKPMMTTYKSAVVLPGSKAFAEYVSTQAFISDMSRRFVSTQQLLQPPTAPSYAAPLPLEVEALHP